MNSGHLPWEPLYYLTHEGIEGDADFYRRFLDTGGKLLELGCGDGRLTEVFLRAGYQVTALDQSVFALNALKSRLKLEHPKALTCIRADFTQPPASGLYDRIVLNFNGLLCLRDSDKLRLFEWIAAHLATDGLFLFDFYDGAPFLENGQTDEEWIYEPQLIKTIYSQGTAFDVYESGLFRSVSDRLEMNYHYFRDGDEDLDENLTYSIVHYPLSETKMRRLVDQAQLSIRRIINVNLPDGRHIFSVVGK